MKRKTGIAGMVLLCVLTAACGSKKGDAVMIVKEGGNTMMIGRQTWETDASGKLAPKVWIPGNVVIFRVDYAVRGQAGKAGHAYQIQKDLSLKEIGKVDLNKNDDQLSEQFLAKK